MKEKQKGGSFVIFLMLLVGIFLIVIGTDNNSKIKEIQNITTISEIDCLQNNMIVYNKKCITKQDFEKQFKLLEEK